MLVNIVQSLSVVLYGLFCHVVAPASFYDNTEVYKLEKYNFDVSAVTLSGFSAGAAMANQMTVAHSSEIMGTAVYSQVFYRCGPKSLYEFGFRCSKRGLGIFPYDVKKSIADTSLYEEQNLIDPVENLKSKRIFIWTGEKDEFIPTDMAVKNQDFYQHFIQDGNKISLTTARNTVHVFPTINFGDKCDEVKDESENYYLGNCNYSGAYHGLKYLLESRIPSLTNEQLTNQEAMVKLSPLLKFNQSEFYPEGSITNEAAMGEIGFVYIPTACYDKERKCLLHFNFHGCNEWPPDVAENYIVHSGFLPLAEANNIIIVFPLTTKVAFQQTMDGCWDFFSYTGPYFATKRGTQIKVVHRMLQRLLYGTEN